jgi:hypothetical protein
MRCTVAAPRTFPEFQAGEDAGAGEDASSRFWVTVARGSHPFPSRTRKLSPSAPMVLHAEVCGRVGRRPIKLARGPRRDPGAFCIWETPIVRDMLRLLEADGWRANGGDGSGQARGRAAGVERA